MMNEEQKREIVEFMKDAGWRYGMWQSSTLYFRIANSPISPNCKIDIPLDFDLNDASLCVDELVKQGIWRIFYSINHVRFLQTMNEDTLASLPNDNTPEYTAYLLTMQSGEATNFFSALAEWIEKEGK
jgi:hypothetical protein